MFKPFTKIALDSQEILQEALSGLEERVREGDTSPQWVLDNIDQWWKDFCFSREEGINSNLVDTEFLAQTRGKNKLKKFQEFCKIIEPQAKKMAVERMKRFLIEGDFPATTTEAGESSTKEVSIEEPEEKALGELENIRQQIHTLKKVPGTATIEQIRNLRIQMNNIKKESPSGWAMTLIFMLTEELDILQRKMEVESSPIGSVLIKSPIDDWATLLPELEKQHGAEEIKKFLDSDSWHKIGGSLEKKYVGEGLEPNTTMEKKDFYNFYAIESLLLRQLHNAPPAVERLAVDTIDTFAKKVHKGVRWGLTYHILSMVIHSPLLWSSLTKTYGSISGILEKLHTYKYSAKELSEISRIVAHAEISRIVAHANPNWFGAWVSISEELVKLENMLPVEINNVREVVQQVDHLIDYAHNRGRIGDEWLPVVDVDDSDEMVEFLDEKSTKWDESFFKQQTPQIYNIFQRMKAYACIKRFTKIAQESWEFEVSEEPEVVIRDKNGLRIGIDIDGVLADTHSVLMDLASEHVPIDDEDRQKYGVQETKHGSDGLRNQVFEEIFEKGLIAEAPMIPGAAEKVNELYDAGNEIYIITARKKNWEEQTKEWLKKNGIKYHRLIMGAGKKGDVAKEEGIQVFIEDSSDNVENLEGNGIRAFIFSQPWNQDSHATRIEQWKNVKACTIPAPFGYGQNSMGSIKSFTKIAGLEEKMIDDTQEEVIPNIVNSSDIIRDLDVISSQGLDAIVDTMKKYPGQQDTVNKWWAANNEKYLSNPSRGKKIEFTEQDFYSVYAVSLMANLIKWAPPATLRPIFRALDTFSKKLIDSTKLAVVSLILDQYSNVVSLINLKEKYGNVEQLLEQIKTLHLPLREMLPLVESADTESDESEAWGEYIKYVIEVEHLYPASISKSPKIAYFIDRAVDVRHTSGYVLKDYMATQISEENRSLEDFLEEKSSSWDWEVFKEHAPQMYNIYQQLKKYANTSSFCKYAQNTNEMEDFFKERTAKHIDLVNKYLEKLKEHYDYEFKDAHDNSKYADPEHEPYLYITWKYKMRDEDEDYEISEEWKDKCDEATFHHIKNNRHHPEYWDDTLTENPVNKENRDEPSGKIVDATKMPDEHILAMVADWCAMSEEKENTPKEWADKNIGTRWEFSPEQEEMIYEAIEKIWGKKEAKLKSFTKFGSPRWTPEDKVRLKELYIKYRQRGIPHHIIYKAAAILLDKTWLAVKQKLESMYGLEDELKGMKFEHWDKAKIDKTIQDLYGTGKPINRINLPANLMYQITNHSVPKSHSQGFPTFYNSFDDAMASNILVIGFEREGDKLTEKPIKTLEDALKFYRRKEKLCHTWTKDEIVELLQEAHVVGLPLTYSFFRSHPDIYKPLMGVSRSLEGLRDSIKRNGYTWCNLVVEAVPEYADFYSEDGRMKSSTEEMRVRRFLELNNIPFKTAGDVEKIAVNDPELNEMGYKHFIPDFVVLDRSGNVSAYVEVFGSIADSGASNTAELYREKKKAKEKFYSTLPYRFIAVNNNTDGIDLTDEILKQKFGSFLGM